MKFKVIFIIFVLLANLHSTTNLKSTAKNILKCNFLYYSSKRFIRKEKIFSAALAILGTKSEFGRLTR